MASNIGDSEAVRLGFENSSPTAELLPEQHTGGWSKLNAKEEVKTSANPLSEEQQTENSFPDVMEVEPDPFADDHHFGNVPSGISHVASVLSHDGHPFEMTRTSWVVAFCFFCLPFAMLIVNPVLGLCGFMTIFGTLPFWRWWFKNRLHAAIQRPIKGMGLGTVVGFLALIVQILIAASGIYFYSKVGGNTFLFVLFAGLIIFGCVIAEEFFKIRVLKYIKIDDPTENETKRDLIVSSFVALGYASFQSILWTLLLYRSIREADFPARVTLRLMALNTFLFIIWGTPLHVLCGYLSGLLFNLEQSAHEIIAVTTLHRSIYVCEMFIFITFPGLATFLICIAVTLLIYFLLYKRIKMAESLMPDAYLDRVGQLSAFGYGRLEG